MAQPADEIQLVPAPPADPAADHSGWMTPWFRGRAARPQWSALRKRWWLIAVCIVLAAGAAGLYLSRATKVYTAEADLLVSPVGGDASALAGLGLITASTDPTRAPATVARIVKTPDVAQAVQRHLASGRSVTSLLTHVSATPAQQGNVVAIHATAGAPGAARQLANAFADAVVASRTAHLHAVVNQALPGVLATAHGLPADDPRVAQVAELQVLQHAPDPTVQVLTHAQTPASPSSPRPLLSLALAIVGGAIVGTFGAFALYIFDPRLRDERTLRDRYRVPVLGRVPSGSAPVGDIGFAARGRALSVVHESFRGLVGGLEAARPAALRHSVVVTGVSGQEGASTTAVGLSRALANAGHKVVLVDANLLHPTIAELLDRQPEIGIEDVLSAEATLADALVTAMPGVRVLMPRHVDRPFARDMLSAEEVERIISAAFTLGNWVVIDAPPITVAADVLPFATLVDHVVIVTRLDHTQLRDLNRLADMYIQHGIEPAGFVVVGG